MNNNINIILLNCLAGSVYGGLIPGCNPHIQKSSHPNVIIVITDDQGYGDFSVHGHPVLKTPVLDQLYHQSIRFTDFHSAPMSTPTRGQLLTGRDAMANGATAVCQGRSMIRKELPTMADIFKNHGYQTAHFGKWHLGDSYPYRPQDRGFDETVHHGAWGIGSLADHVGNDYWDDHFLHNGQLKKYEGYCTDVWFDLAINYIKKWNKKGERTSPFLLYLATNCPHSPHLVDEKYSGPYLQQGFAPRVAGFFGQVANIDENMQRLLSFLDEIRLSDNTILIYMSDNGTYPYIAEVYNAGMRGCKTQLWEGGHRVPLFIRWPKGNLGEPRDIDILSHCQDILPTLIDLCGINKPLDTEFDGVSLVPLLRGEKEALEDRMLVVAYGPDYLPETRSAVLWNKWRLVGTDKLYDLSTDPHQDRDVSASYPDILEAMQNHLHEWWIRTRPEFGKKRHIHIGSDQQNPLMLYSSDWDGSFADILWNLLQGDGFGSWDIYVETAGEYEITLYRWHPASNIPLNAEYPDLDPVYTQQNKGALPIAMARLKIGDFDQIIETPEGISEIKFKVKLDKGENKIETWFMDSNQNKLCSAYYTKVKL